MIDLYWILSSVGSSLICYSQDYTWTDLVYKRSTDGGVTWSNMTILYSNSTSDEYNVVGNAAVVQDRSTGRLDHHLRITSYLLMIKKPDALLS